MSTMYPLDPVPNRSRVDGDIRPIRGERQEIQPLAPTLSREHDTAATLTEPMKLLELEEYLDAQSTISVKGIAQRRKNIKKYQKKRSSQNLNKNTRPFLILLLGGVVIFASALFTFAPGLVIGTVLAIIGFMKVSFLQSENLHYMREENQFRANLNDKLESAESLAEESTIPNENDKLVSLKEAPKDEGGYSHPFRYF